MGAFKKLPNSIRILPNRRKVKKIHPDWVGTMIDKNGEEYYVSLWKVATKKETILMGQVKPAADFQKGNKAAIEKARIEENNNLSEIPF